MDGPGTRQLQPPGAGDGGSSGPPGGGGNRPPPENRPQVNRVGSSYTQKRSLQVVSKITAALSIIGSAFIIYDIMVRDKKQRKFVQNQILLALSAVDICSSIWIFIGHWAIPEIFSSNRQPGASGNTQTCAAQGFFIQMGLAVPWYNAALALYYLLMLNHGRRLPVRIQKMAPAFWGMPLLFGLATAVAGLCLDLFNYFPAFNFCWISGFPVFCDGAFDFKDRENPGISCQRGDNAQIYRLAFGYIPLWTAFTFMCIAFVLVFWQVRHQEAKTKRWSQQWMTGNVGSSALAQSESRTYKKRRTSSLMSGSNSRELVDADVNRQISLDDNLKNDKCEGDSKVEAGKMGKGSGEAESDFEEDQVKTTTSESEECKTEEVHAQAEEEGDSNSTNPEIESKYGQAQDELEQGQADSRTMLRSSSSRGQSNSASAPQSVRVAMQSLCYVGAFFLTWTFPFVSTLQSEFSNTKKQYWLELMVAIFLPLQGFFNCLVYVRPRFLNRKKS